MAVELAPHQQVPQARVTAVTRSFLLNIARGALVAFAVQVAGAGLTYLTQIAFARWMGISQFGIYAYVTAWATIIALLAGLGFPMSVLRFIPEYRAHGDHARLRGLVHVSRWATLGAGLLVAALGTIVAVLVGRDVAIVALGLWLVPAGALINLDTSIVRAGGRVVAAYAPSLVLRPLMILLLTFGAWLTFRRTTATTGLLITLAVFAAVGLLQSTFVHQFLASYESPASRAIYEPRTWLRVSAPLFLVAGFQVALAQTDLVVIGAARGVRYAALYSAASRTAILVGFLLVALSFVTAPLFAELEARRDRIGLQRLATVSAQWVFWPTLLLAVALAGLAPFVLGLFGSGFGAARSALLILLLGQLVSAGCGAVGYLLGMTGHHNDLVRVYGVTSLLNVAICYIGARTYGLAGAAWGTTFTLIAWNIWLHRLTTKRLGVRASILSALRRDREVSA